MSDINRESTIEALWRLKSVAAMMDDSQRADALMNGILASIKVVEEQPDIAWMDKPEPYREDER